ncbi:hypothetical protein MFIFM68171_02533 [Madurella fahalii]|uniref:Ankyrin repeat domain-containing protein n=1 Tax=Madurella fahalii TaxID=1157608 RepID=A0ABQ0G3I3_9PEZI
MHRLQATSLIGQPSSLAAAVRRLAATLTGRPSPVAIDLPTASGNETPLVLAINSGYRDVVSELVEAGADVNASTPGGPSPMTTAVR